MAHHNVFQFQSIFPQGTHDNFDPVEGFPTLTHGFYQYEWPGGPWPVAHRPFARDLVHWFRRLPRGTNEAMLRVRDSDGGWAPSRAASA